MGQTILQDLRFALRTLAKSPGFTAAVVATIALGIGATTAIFTVVNAVLFRPLPFPQSERAVMFCETNPSVGDWCGASPPNVADWARAARSLDSAGVARTEPFIGRDGSRAYGVDGGIASPGFFRVLRTRPALGRLLEERDMARGANHVALVSHAYWTERLQADRSIVGRVIVLDEQPFTVIGVLPADAYVPGGFLSAVEVWKPLTASVDRVDNRSWRGFTAIGRLADGASPAMLRVELDTIRAQLEKAYPEANVHWGLRIGNLRREMVGDVSTRLWIFLGAVAFVLLIACANVASLLLVRATGRGAEFAVRASLGAGRRRLVQQLVTESGAIALAGGALGLLLAIWATTGFVALAPSTIPRLGEVTIDARVVIFAFLLAAATAVIFGLAPARYAARATLSDALRGARLTRGTETRVRSALVVVEVALGLMLLVGAALLTRTFARLTQWDPGFDRAGLVTAWVLPSSKVADPVNLMQRVRDEVAAIPGVRSAALGSGGPLFGGTETGGLSIEGRAPYAPADMPTIAWFDIGPHYFATLGVRFLRGRQFTPADDRAAPDVAIVNATFVRRFFQGENPIGRRVTVNDHAAEIVGVVGDVAPFEPSQPTMPQIYWPIEQYRRGAAYLLIRIAPGSSSVERAVQARASAVSAGMQVAPLVSLDERVSRRLVSPRFNMLLVGVFALVALVLAMIGVYGVVAHTVASRTREIGVRVALGATPGQVSAAVIRRGMFLVSMGIAAGCGGALATGRLLASVLSGLRAGDPVALGAAVFLFLAVSLLACWLPARRASRLDPTVALRVE